MYIAIHMPKLGNASGMDVTSCFSILLCPDIKLILKIILAKMSGMPFGDKKIYINTKNIVLLFV